MAFALIVAVKSRLDLLAGAHKSRISEIFQPENACRATADRYTEDRSGRMAQRIRLYDDARAGLRCDK
jgi:hypothetical protein